MALLSEDEYECPSCFNDEHHCRDLFNFPPFGLIACACQPCIEKRNASL